MSGDHINDGGAAFPRIERIQTPSSIHWSAPEFSKVESSDGMSLRDYFAAQALSSMPGFDVRVHWNESEIHEHGRVEATAMATAAYELADAMLKARAA